MDVIKVLRASWARLMLGLAAVILPAVAAAWLTRQLGMAHSVLRVISPLASAGSGYIGYYLFVRYIERRAAIELDPRNGLRLVTIGLMIGILLFGATMGILGLIGLYTVTGSNSPATVVAPLAAAISAGILEELVFRGVIFRILELRFGTWVALLASAALFGLLHLLNPNASIQGAVAIIFEAGILLAAAFVLTKHLWFPIGIHIGWNFAEGGLFGAAVSGGAASGLLKGATTGPVWLTGGDFGPEASTVAIVICVTVASGLLLAATRRGLLRKP